MTTALLRQALPASDTARVRMDGLVAHDADWQVPAATEKVAWDRISASGPVPGVEYVGFPWATLIDGLRSGASVRWHLLAALERLRLRRPRGGRCATVAQHIHAATYARYFAACGITDMLWCHATHERPTIGGIRLQPFPLYPAQTADLTPPKPAGPRRYLANFIGAYNPKVYLTDVRTHIFADAGTSDDLLIVKREAWHFNRAVYDEQMKGEVPGPEQLRQEARHREQYLDAIRHSTFTLCPSGSGPNSIRIGEALALGSIPIVLTRSLRLAGDPTLWKSACLIEEDSADGYRRALAHARRMPPEEILHRQAAVRDLHARVAPSAWDGLARDLLRAAA